MFARRLRPVRIGALTLLLLFNGNCLSSGQAQEVRTPIIGVIDMQRILRESIAVQTLSDQIEELRDDYQAELRLKEEKFREDDLLLSRQRAILAPEFYTQRRSELEKRAAELQRNFQERKKELDRLFGQGMSQVQQVLIQVSQEIASEKGLDLLLAKSTVVLVKPDLEITEEALARLNSNLPQVSSPPPAE